MTMSEPLVSVVVSTHDRPARLARLLDGLRAQSIACDRFEVVVVDDGSGPATGELLERERARGELQLQVVRHGVARGPGAGRNAGWPLTRAPLVAFTDDDCVPAPSWLAAGLEAAAALPGAIVQGRTEPDPGGGRDKLLLSRTVRVATLGPQYETCNILYPRSVLEWLGGFDEGFGLCPGGEDTDLAWRALERGATATFSPAALVFHAVQRLGLLGTLREATRWTATVRVLAEHPGARAILHRRCFWNVWHYLLWRSLLALVGPAWLRRLVWARHLGQLRARGRQGGAGAWSVPFLLLHDVIETCAVVRGAVRYRTPVL
ncbi:MAG: hypothetical protein DLM64_01245 [Solirubrobacterales bacterium]|nr:MAG: hypothetical protein DLM64_01245 [Solirubrobacterales bacterium]